MTDLKLVDGDEAIGLWRKSKVLAGKAWRVVTLSESSGPPPYVAETARLAAPRTVLRSLWRSFVVRPLFLLYRLLPIFEAHANVPHPVTKVDPAGEFADDHVPLAQAMFDDQQSRRSALEEKASAVLAQLTFLVPLVLGVIVYVSTSGVASVSGPWTERLATASMVLLVISFASALRALWIAGRQHLGVATLIDVPNRSVLPYSANRHVRGLIWCATQNAGLNDELGNHVRAAHVFLVMSGGALLAACFVLLPTLAPAAQVEPTEIRGSLTVEAAGIEQAVRESAAGSSRMSAIEERVLALEVELRFSADEEADAKEAPTTARDLKGEGLR